MLCAVVLSGIGIIHADTYKPEPTTWYRVLSMYDGNAQDRVGRVWQVLLDGNSQIGSNNAEEGALWTIAAPTEESGWTDDYLFRFVEKENGKYSLVCKALDGKVLIDYKPSEEQITDHKFKFVDSSTEGITEVEFEIPNNNVGITDNGNIKIACKLADSKFFNASASGKGYCVNNYGDPTDNKGGIFELVPAGTTRNNADHVPTAKYIVDITPGDNILSLSSDAMWASIGNVTVADGESVRKNLPTTNSDYLSLMGIKYASGVGVHATGKMIIDTRNATHINAIIGISDFAANQTNHGIATLIIKTYALGTDMTAENGTQIVSQEITRGQAPYTLDLDLTNVDYISIIYDAGSKNFADHVNIANAYLTKGTGTDEPAYVTEASLNEALADAIGADLFAAKGELAKLLKRSVFFPAEAVATATMVYESSESTVEQVNAAIEALMASFVTKDFVIHGVGDGNNQARSNYYLNINETPAGTWTQVSDDNPIVPSMVWTVSKAGEEGKFYIKNASITEEGEASYLSASIQDGYVQLSAAPVAYTIDFGPATSGSLDANNQVGLKTGTGANSYLNFSTQTGKFGTWNYDNGCAFIFAEAPEFEEEEEPVVTPEGTPYVINTDGKLQRCDHNVWTIKTPEETTSVDGKRFVFDTTCFLNIYATGGNVMRWYDVSEGVKAIKFFAKNQNYTISVGSPQYVITGISFNVNALDEGVTMTIDGQAQTLTQGATVSKVYDTPVTSIAFNVSGGDGKWLSPSDFTVTLKKISETEDIDPNFYNNLVDATGESPLVDEIVNSNGGWFKIRMDKVPEGNENASAITSLNNQILNLATEETIDDNSYGMQLGQTTTAPIGWIFIYRNGSSTWTGSLLNGHHINGSGESVVDQASRTFFAHSNATIFDLGYDGADADWTPTGENKVLKSAHGQTGTKWHISRVTDAELAQYNKVTVAITAPEDYDGEELSVTYEGEGNAGIATVFNNGTFFISGDAPAADSFSATAIDGYTANIALTDGALTVTYTVIPDPTITMTVDEANATVTASAEAQTIPVTVNITNPVEGATLGVEVDGTVSETWTLTEAESAYTLTVPANTAAAAYSVKAIYNYGENKIVTSADAITITINAAQTVEPEPVATTDLTLTVNREAGSTDITMAVTPEDSGISADFVSVKKNDDVCEIKTGASTGGKIVPNVNQNVMTETDVVTMTFSVTGIPAGTKIEGIALDVHAMNASGGYQNKDDADKNRKYNFGVAFGDNAENTFSWNDEEIATTGCTDTENHKVFEATSETGYTVPESTDPLIIKVSFSKGTQADGCFFGLRSIGLVFAEESEEPTPVAPEFEAGTPTIAGEAQTVTDGVVELQSATDDRTIEIEIVKNTYEADALTFSEGLTKGDGNMTITVAGGNTVATETTYTVTSGETTLWTLTVKVDAPATTPDPVEPDPVEEEEAKVVIAQPEEGSGIATEYDPSVVGAVEPDVLFLTEIAADEEHAEEVAEAHAHLVILHEAEMTTIPVASATAPTGKNGTWRFESTNKKVAEAAINAETGKVEVTHKGIVGTTVIRVFFDETPATVEGETPAPSTTVRLLDESEVETEVTEEETPAALLTLHVEVKMPAGETPTLTAVGRTTIEMQTGKTAKLETASNVDNVVNWSSSNTDVATVDEDGVVTAVAAGTAIIRAALDGTDQIVEFTVRVTVPTGPIGSGIEAINADAAEGRAAIYDLQGRKLERISAAGLYIVNGVKTIVR